MTKNKNLSSLTACIIAIIVSAWLSPLNKYFLPNFFFYLSPQIIILPILMMLRTKSQICSACSFSLTIFLLLYGLWVKSLPHYEGLEWLGYFFSVPGGVVGIISILIYFKCFKSQEEDENIFVFTFIIVSLGLLINCFILFNTVMYGPLTIFKI